MKTFISALLLAAMTICTTASATEPPPRVGATKPLSAPTADPKVAAPKDQSDEVKGALKAADGKSGSKAAAKTTAERGKPKRRAVYQQFDEPDMRTPPTAVYAPTLTPRDNLLPRTDPTPAPPVTINCVGAACSDASGGYYRGGVGTSLISPAGRICNNNGITVQCH